MAELTEHLVSVDVEPSYQQNNNKTGIVNNIVTLADELNSNIPDLDSIQPYQGEEVQTRVRINSVNSNHSLNSTGMSMLMHVEKKTIRNKSIYYQLLKS